MTRPINMYTDGSCLSNGRAGAVGGYSVVCPENPSANVSRSLGGSIQTSNRAEYSAAVEAMRQADRVDPSGSRPLRIHTDSKLLVDSVNNYMPSWKSNDWTRSNGEPVKNQDLLREIDHGMRTRDVEFVHVPAHTGRNDSHSRWNSVADQNANYAARNNSRYY